MSLLWVLRPPFFLGGGGRGDVQRPFSPYLQEFTSYNFKTIKYVQIQNIDEIGQFKWRKNGRYTSAPTTKIWSSEPPLILSFL